MRSCFVVRTDSFQGGGEILVERTRAALERRGVEIEFFEGEVNADIVHFFGVFPEHEAAYREAVRGGIPWVCTPIYVNRRLPGALRRHAFRNKYLRRTFLYWQADMLGDAHAVLTPGRWEYEKILAYFGRAAKRVAVPSGVDPIFAEGSAEAFWATYDGPPFALCVGRFDKDKNQLTLARAARLAQRHVVFVGGGVDSDYGRRCREAAGPYGRFIERMEHGPMLANAYAAARLFALPTRHETFCLAALESLSARCPTFVASGWQAEDFFGTAINQVPPNDVPAWADVLARDHPKPVFDARPFSWDVIAGKILDVYKEMGSASLGSRPHR